MPIGKANLHGRNPETKLFRTYQGNKFFKDGHFEILKSRNIDFKFRCEEESKMSY